MRQTERLWIEIKNHSASESIKHVGIAENNKENRFSEIKILVNTPKVALQVHDFFKSSSYKLKKMIWFSELMTNASKPGLGAWASLWSQKTMLRISAFKTVEIFWRSNVLANFERNNWAVQ